MLRYCRFVLIFLLVATGATAQEEWKSLVSQDGVEFLVEGAEKISSERALELLNDGATFIDVRRESSYKMGHIPGASNLDVNHQLTEESLAAVVGKDQKVVFYCSDNGCYRSANASAMALNWGYTDVAYYAPGWSVWLAEGYPRE